MAELLCLYKDVHSSFLITFRPNLWTIYDPPKHSRNNETQWVVYNCFLQSFRESDDYIIPLSVGDEEFYNVILSKKKKNCEGVVVEVSQEKNLGGSRKMILSKGVSIQVNWFCFHLIVESRTFRLLFILYFCLMLQCL